MSTNAADGVPPSTSAPSSTTPTSQPPPQVQQPLQPPHQPQAQASSAAAQSSVAGDSLTCQWSNCGERCATPEQLYDHVCERHVGRKSTNNLNLTCQWGNCRTTTVKRDHITSHIRVHVPLKPHKCDFCGKAFKRPQDLKKHVKTHADDSVLLRSPEPNRGAPHGGPGGGYQAAAGKPGGFYPDTSMGGAPQYGHPQGGPNQAYYPTTAPTAYGQVYYAVNQNQNLQSDYEIRKRAAYDALNEFFGDAKRRAIDTTNYHEVGNRLMAIAPAVGYYGGIPEYSAAPVMASPGGVHGPLPTPQYSLPLPNLRTKSDLQQIDQFLEQLQTSAYENSNQAAAAGVAQPGAHYLHPSVSYRTSNSPPGAQTGTLPQTSHATAHTPLSAPPSTETPALTPASSVLSYTSGQSPNSVNSSNTISPTSRSNMGSMYPTLPSVSAMSDIAGNYAATSSAAAPALAPSFEDNRRRYSGPMLQKAAPARRSSDYMDVDDSPSPKNVDFSRRSSASIERDGLRKLALGSPGLDPALQSPMRSPLLRSSSSSSTNPADAEQERWVENIRTIEFLRNMVKDRLERGEFEDDERRHSTPRAGHMTEDEQNLYPVLRHVQDS